MPYRRHRIALALIAVGVGGGAVEAQDRITVEGHIAVGNGPVTGFVTTAHHSSTWVYAEHEQGKGATLIDLTRPAHPKVVSEIASDTLLSVNGTTGITVGAQFVAPVAAPPKTIRVMDFSDPKNPKVTRQFDGVTSIGRIGRGLILLANPEGVWILSEHLADDPEVDARYARKVVYGESMY
jgi:hypothetical protein